MSIIISGGAGNTFKGISIGASGSSVMYFRCRHCKAQQRAVIGSTVSFDIPGNCPFCGHTGCLDCQIKSEDSPAPPWFDATAVRLQP